MKWKVCNCEHKKWERFNDINKSGPIFWSGFDEYMWKCRLVCQVCLEGVWQNFDWKDTDGDHEQYLGIEMKLYIVETMHRLGFSPSVIIEKYMMLLDSKKVCE